MGNIQIRNTKASVPKSKYEMNLAEFPLAFLTTKIPKGTDALEYQDTIIGKDGKEIQRRWKIYPHPKYGFPTPSTQHDFIQKMAHGDRKGRHGPPLRHLSSTMLDVL
jgi:hypothetical protein